MNMTKNRFPMHSQAFSFGEGSGYALKNWANDTSVCNKSEQGTQPISHEAFEGWDG